MTTQQYIKDPRTGKLRPVVYLDQHGRPVEPPPGAQVLLAPPAGQPPAQAHVPTPHYPQPAAPAQPQLPPMFLPPGVVPQRYSITVRYDMGRPAGGQGYAAQGGGGLLNTVYTALGLAALVVALYLAWRVVLPAAGGQAPPTVALPDVRNVLGWGADVARGFTAPAEEAPTAPETPREPPVLGEATIPQDLGSLTLQGPPSVSAGLIDEYLEAQGSPAAGTGAEWYMAALETGIDPVFGIAFFLHESGLGVAPQWAGHKGDGATTHNVGNIICAGYVTCYGRFRDYPDWGTGIRDWYRLIDVEYIQGRKHQTVADVIPVYAPAVENDVARYIAAVQESVVALRQREQARQAARGGDAKPETSAGAALAVAETPRLRVTVTELRPIDGGVLALGEIVNTTGAAVTVPASALIWADDGGAEYTVAEGEAEIPPGAALPFEQEVPVPAGRALTGLTVAHAPDEPVTVPLGAGQAGRGAPSPASAAQEPAGCPVRPTAGRVVMTQGYGVGTHAPAAIWGGIDLAVDGNGDGAADIPGSIDQPIVAMHAGVVTFTPDSDPGGNYVTVTSDDGVWRTEYGHLAQVLVQTGDRVEAGQQIGTMGRTGRTTGEHLHLAIWRSGVNIDPAGLVRCEGGR